MANEKSIVDKRCHPVTPNDRKHFKGCLTNNSTKGWRETTGNSKIVCSPNVAKLSCRCAQGTAFFSAAKKRMVHWLRRHRGGMIITHLDTDANLLPIPTHCHHPKRVTYKKSYLPPMSFPLLVKKEEFLFRAHRAATCCSRARTWGSCSQCQRLLSTHRTPCPSPDPCPSTPKRGCC